MSYFCVQSRAAAGPRRTYWVQADSTKAARTLVALNVAAAVEARDETLFDCIQDERRSNGSLADTRKVGVVERG